MAVGGAGRRRRADGHHRRRRSGPGGRRPAPPRSANGSRATDTTGRTAEDVDLGITISPDGTHVVFVRNGLERGGSAHRASVDGTEEHVLVTSETDHLSQLPFGSVADQARRIAFQTKATDLTGDPDNGAFNIHVLDVATP